MWKDVTITVIRLDISWHAGYKDPNVPWFGSSGQPNWIGYYESEALALAALCPYIAKGWDCMITQSANDE